MIPDNVVQDILEYGGNNIVSIIGDYVGLKENKGAYTACCPFHSEKTPSFRVDPKRKTWRCFGSCTDGGNVVRFLMRLEGIKFPAALQIIAKRAGITIPDRAETKEDLERKAMLNMMAKAQQFFTTSLMQNQNGGTAYVQSRMTDAMVEEYGIGYAPSGGRALVSFLEKSSQPLELAEKVGLLRKDDKGQYQDLFWSRVMFPIRDIKGRIIAFAGRRTSDGPYKYLNSPEMPLWKKSATLYGLDAATIEAILAAGEAWLVEGYLDVMQMRKAGIKNTVATCGTAFTKEHVAMLKKYTKRLNLLFDGDDAGRKALQKGVLLAQKEEVKSRVFILPEGEDPDSYFKAGGKVESLSTMSGLDYLESSGAEMSITLKDLHRLERLEKGMLYLAQHDRSVAKILERRGNLAGLFGPEMLPQIEAAIAAAR